MSKINPSREQLAKSLDRRIRHLMIRTLETFEDAFPDKDDIREGQIFKSNLRNMFNDVLRAQRDELHDYEVEYRPLRMTDDNTLTLTSTFLQSIKYIGMDIYQDKLPLFCIFASDEHAKVLEAIRSEFGTGVVSRVVNNAGTPLEKESLVFEIVGIDACINSVLPIMDRYSLHADVRARYQNWRSKVVKLYKEQGNG